MSVTTGFQFLRELDSNAYFQLAQDTRPQGQNCVLQDTK